ncbi:tRNA (adenosine(37)-N6)-dimethylallyltransferase MiaA [Alphaproteobacteria bacterium]|nr:tRNA (adenosine(37)-N6)-dimethylallyltransferase MiaA [Alphaproteobacteria bacterium]
MDKQSKIILISGPTASGKSNFAVKIAKKIEGEIINADSMQVYKKLKILTARPNKQEQKDIKHHLYGVVELNEKFSTGQWLELTIKKIKNIQKKKQIPILVGGTGLYFQSLINGLVKIPEIPLKFRNKFDPNDTQRSIRAYEIKSYTGISMYDWLTKTKSEFKESDFLKLHIEIKREKLIERINLRTSSMISSGAINEVKKFLKLKIRKDQSVNKVIGIAELTQYLNHEITLDEAKELILIKTRQYAKRQATWARTRMMSWIKIDPNKVDSYIKKLKKSSLKLDQLT